MEPLILWIGGSVLIAYLGRHRSVGPWGFLLFSLIFSPIIGALGLMVSGRRRTEPSPDVARLTSAVQSLQHASQRQQALLEGVCTQLRDLRGAEPAAQSDAGQTGVH